MKVPFKVDLSGKVCAITGAGGVICGEFARALAECGAKVALLDINYDAAKKVADEIGENAFAVKCNCLDKADIVKAKAAVEEKFGAVNFLVNGAGGNNPRATTDNETMTPDLSGVKDFFALEESGLKFVFDLNITSAFLVTQVFAEGMVKTGGNIINISSMNAYRPLTKIPAYSAAKAGVISLTKSFALELADYDINSNAVAAGWVESEQVLSNDRWKDALPSIPSRRLGKLSEIAESVAFLCNDKVSYINGEILDVNGGIIMD